jgi:hypothetical protein
MKKFLSSLFLAMVLSVSALAQYPASPNTGQATTPYATNVFSITFNGPVAITNVGRNSENTSNDMVYSSDNGKIFQFVTLRTIDHAISVDFTSSDFYVNNQSGCDTKTDISQGTWDNRPYSYSFCTFTLDGQKYTLRTRYIIVNSTTVLMVKQAAKEDDNNRDVWLDFEYSLRIR